jgi:hypothetical protein
VDEVEGRRFERHFYPRPSEDVIDVANLRGFHNPEDQQWLRGDDLHVDQPRPFLCGFHADTRNDRPISEVDLDGLDGKVYRVGQCRQCGRMFWGVKGERSDRNQ